MFSITKSLKKAFTCILRWRSDVKLERVYPGPPGRAPFYGSLISHPHRHSRAPTDIILFSFFSSLSFFLGACHYAYTSTLLSFWHTILSSSGGPPLAWFPWLTWIPYLYVYQGIWCSLMIVMIIDSGMQRLRGKIHKQQKLPAVDISQWT